MPVAVRSEIEIPAAGIGFGAVGEIAEGHEQAPHVFLVGLDERGQRQRLPLQRELERPIRR